MGAQAKIQFNNHIGFGKFGGRDLFGGIGGLPVLEKDHVANAQ